MVPDNFILKLGRFSRIILLILYHIMIIALTASDNGSIASQEVEMETVYNFFVCKDNANEGNGSLLTISRAQLVLCKDNAR